MNPSFAMSLSEKQRLFARLFFEWGVWANSLPGVELVLAEGYVGITDAKDGDYDGPHLKNGGHYNKLAHDVDLFVDGAYVADGGHQMWRLLGENWEARHPLCRWGGHFASRDDNHVSLIHEGVA